MSASKVGVTKTLHLRVALLADSLADADEAFKDLERRILQRNGICPQPMHHMFFAGNTKYAKVIVRELTVTP